MSLEERVNSWQKLEFIKLLIGNWETRIPEGRGAGISF